MSNNEQLFAAMTEFIASLPVKRFPLGCACGAVRNFPTPPEHIAKEIGERTILLRSRDACEGIHGKRGCYYPTHATANKLNGDGPGWWYDNDGVVRPSESIAGTMAKHHPEGPDECVFVLADGGINNIPNQKD